MNTNFSQIRKSRKSNVALIADDDTFMRTLIKNTFRDIADVIEAKSGDHVLELYQQYVPDLVLLDIHMPIKDGREVLKEIRGVDTDAFVIMVSSDAISENVLNTSLSGAKGFIVKPFSSEALMKYALRCPTFTFQDQPA